jgi:CheY-like chemotaxis protein/curved DNA-binding protein CbpA
LAKILVLHNNKKRLKELHHAFIKAGYDVIFSSNGKEGEVLFQEENPDCVVADLLLSGKQGGDLAKAIKATAKGADTPVILTSPLFRKMQLAETAQKQWNVDEFFADPYELEDVIEAVHRLVGKGKSAPKQPEQEMPVAAPPAPAEEELAEDFDPAALRKKIKPVKPKAEKKSTGLENALFEAASEAADDFDLLDLAGMTAGSSKAEDQEQEEAPPLTEGDGIPARGNLENVSVPELFTAAYLAAQNGVLEVRNIGAARTVYFRNGAPVSVEGGSRSETLGQVLVKHGIITAEAAFLALQKLPDGVRQGEALVEMGELTSSQLLDGLKLQAREKMLNLFAWFEGEFIFEPGEIDTTKMTPHQVDPIDLAFVGIREHLPTQLIVGIFKETETFPIRRKRELEATETLPESCRKVFDLIDGIRTVAQVKDECGLDETEASQVLYTLLLLSLFEQGAPSKVARAGQTQAARDSSEDYEVDGIDPALMSAIASGAQLQDDSAEMQDLDEEDLDQAFKEAEVRIERRRAERTEAAIVEKEAKSDAGKVKDRPEAKRATLSVADEELKERIVSEYLALESANHYEVLHLDRKCTDQEFKDRYREYAKTLHTDLLRDRFEPDIINKANELMSRISDAYRELSDPKRRLAYDRRLSPEGKETRERHISSILVAEHEFNLGVAAMNRGAWGQARNHFQKAIDAFPEESIYYAHLGWVIYKDPVGTKKEKSLRATQYLERAVKINPKADKPYYYLGVILQDNGYLDKAARMFAQAFRYNRKNVLAQRALAEIQRQKVEDREAAKKRARQRLEKEAPQFSDESSIKEILSKDMDLKSVKKAFLKLFW